MILSYDNLIINQNNWKQGLQQIIVLGEHYTQDGKYTRWKIPNIH